MNNKEITECLIKINKLINLNKYDVALNLIDLLLSEELSYFNLADAYNYKAICFVNLNNYGGALEFLNKSYELDEHLINHKLYDNVFNRVYKTNFKRSYYLIKIKSYLIVNKVKKASYYFKRFSKDNIMSYTELLQFFKIDEIFKLKPNDYHFKEYVDCEFKKYFNMGKQSWANDDFNEAVILFDKALDFKPNDTLTWYLKILALNDLHRTEDVIFCCKLLLGLQTTDEDDFHNVVCCLYEVGQYDGLREYCDKALVLYPNNRMINEIKEALVELEY